MSKQKQFAAKVDALVAQSKLLAPATKKEVTELLDQVTNQIRGRLAGMNPQTFQAAQLRVLKMHVDHAFDVFRAKALRDVLKMQKRAALLGAAIVAAPLGEMQLHRQAMAAGSFAPLARVATDRVAIAENYTADLITSLSRKSAADVNAAIARAFMGGQNVTDIMGQIGNIVGAERAEAVTVTEVLRVHSIAQQARLEEESQRHPDLAKAWQHVNAARVPRVAHIRVSGQVRKVDQPFDVDGEQLMFPRDPNGSAYNTINCHCLMRPHFSEEALKPSDRAKGLLDSLGISVETEDAA